MIVLVKKDGHEETRIVNLKKTIPVVTTDLGRAQDYHKTIVLVPGIKRKCS